MDFTTCRCTCGFTTSNRKSLSRHKQACKKVLFDVHKNLNVLESRVTTGHTDDVDGIRSNIDDVDVYDLDDYEVASLSDIENDNVSDANFGNYLDEDENSAAITAIGVDVDSGEEHSMMDGVSIEFDANSDAWSEENSSYLSSADSDDGNDGNKSLPEYNHPIFPSRRIVLSAAYQLQVKLNALFDRNKASLGMYNDIIRLFNEYIESPEFNRMTMLRPRQQFMAQTEQMFQINRLKPTYSGVRLTDNTVATVPVFDAEAMILSLLHDPILFRKENLAEGYDIFTGYELDSNNKCNDAYGEIHTGDAWTRALTRYCGTEGKYMPIALLIFGDKSHTDLHGLLSVEPVSFTLSLFNLAARNLPQFWRLLGYIPNLSAGKGDANRMSAKDKIQNEHNCLSYVFKSIRDIHNRGGIRTSVMGRHVHIKVWIHYFIGDTEGHNKWLGHYPGNNSGIRRPYRDCQCSFPDLRKTNPTCLYTTLREMEDARTVLENNEQEGLALFQRLSRYPIKNALLERGLPLSDHVHGPFRMTPPELLHTSGAGLILYMFRVIADRVGAGMVRDDLDNQHVRMMKSLQRQSERDFPRGATRNGIVDGTKCQASERRGNLFSLTCIVHTKDGLVLKEGLQMSDDEWRNLVLFLRQYLGLEEWMHSFNKKTQVQSARPKIGRVLKALQTLLPRGEGTNGWNIPKMHGMTKIQFYITLYGCAMNFFGGPGESSHKQFVKAPGLKTQRRVCEFACQTAKQYHHVMIAKHALTCLNMTVSSKHDDVVISNSEKTIMEGKYCIDLTEDDCFHKNRMCLRLDLLEIYERDCDRIQNLNGKITGYTRARCIDRDGQQSIYYAHPSYRGAPWYDWAFVHFVERGEEVYYPSLILGFVAVCDATEAVIQCSTRPMKWSTVENNMFVPFALGVKSDSFVRVPLSSFVFPLCVIKDYGGEKHKYFVVLPKRGWGSYFGKDIT